MNSASPLAHFPLCQLPVGSTGRVCELVGEDDFRQRLREMGFAEAVLVTKISGSTTSLCQINGTRIALSHGAAMKVLVELLPIKPAHGRTVISPAVISKPEAGGRAR